jgi:hypothetical protein
MGLPSLSVCRNDSAEKIKNKPFFSEDAIEERAEEFKRLSEFCNVLWIPICEFLRTGNFVFTLRSSKPQVLMILPPPRTHRIRCSVILDSKTQKMIK